MRKWGNFNSAANDEIKCTNLNALFGSFSEHGANVLEVGGLLLLLDLDGAGALDDGLGALLLADERGAARKQFD